MTVFLQVISFVLIAGAAVGWGYWVRETHWPAKAPRHISEIHLHGLDQSEALAQAIAVGVVGQIAEHKRMVDFINGAALAAGGDRAIGSLVRVSQPAPELIAAPKTAEALDISIEFAGSKVATKGLQALFAQGRRRGGLSLSLLLEKAGDGTLKGLASASLPENRAYGFSIEVSGQPRDVAQQIAMRFVQSHYAVSDGFYAALEPEQFRDLWSVRREAAEIAMRSVGAATGDEALRREARDVYEVLQPLTSRYTRRPELQRLGAYLASVGEDFASARAHLEAVIDQTAEAGEKETLARLAAALKADEEAKRGTQLARGSRGAGAGAEPAGAADASELESLILEQPVFRDGPLAGLVARARRADPSREVTVGLVLGGFEPFPPLTGRVRPAGDDDASGGGALGAHTEQVASLIATLAPRAEVLVFRAIDEKGLGNTASIVAAITRALAAEVDIVVLPLGPFEGSVYADIVREARDRDVLVIAAAGNSGAETKAAAALPGVLYVGSLEEGRRAAYSNHGDGVQLYAPGRSLVFDRTGPGEMRGTTVSAAVAAAVAANLRLLAEDDPGAAGLRDALEGIAKQAADGGRLLAIAPAPPGN